MSGTPNEATPDSGGRRRLGTGARLAACVLFGALALPAPAAAQEDLRWVRTESPRETLGSFLRLRDVAEEAVQRYVDEPTRAHFQDVLDLMAPFAELLDLSAVPAAAVHEVASDTLDNLLDIFGRVDLPPLESVPDVEAFDHEGAPTKWRIPRTPIWIARVEDGPREGEFLFSSRTVEVAPRFYRSVRHLPLRTSLGLESWSEAVSQMHGPLIPRSLVRALPDGLRRIWFGTPAWKVLASLLLGGLTALLLFALHRLLNRRALKSPVALRLRRLITPGLTILVVDLLLTPFLAFELNVSGSFARSLDTLTTAVNYLAGVWLFWSAVMLVCEWGMRSPGVPAGSLDAGLMRLSARVVGFVGGVVVLAYGAHDLGLPVYGLLTGLGVGGLAVALAIRPTLENLIGGLILFTDRPVRVGDFCSFGQHTGTVEGIGVRSTTVRALDRTLISVPNATFADMEIINWARCDKMLIEATIGLRYETEPDQLRHVMARMREMFHAHPKIDHDTVRVRLCGFGASSLDVKIRVHALTREWNEFHAIREDALLRVSEIVAGSGTSFAFPSRTLYVGRDGGLDPERGQAAVEEVQAWRRSGHLPFPNMEAARIEALADTLDYPPRGSSGAETPTGGEAEESLSAEPTDELEDAAGPGSESARG